MSRVELYYLPIDRHGFDIDLELAVSLLDKSEEARYHRFKNEHARQCFLQARRIVKTQLAEKLGCAPAEILFDYTNTEKPFLKNQNADIKWHFNISHSQSYIIVALSALPVGVDVEDVSRCFKIWRRAENFLNAYVKDCVLKGKTELESATIFAEHWSATESYIKLKGSTIYQEKERVKARPHSNFSAGRRKTFEDACFTVVNLTPEARICVATENVFPEIEVIYWRTGNREQISEMLEVDLSE